jgi:hypothetical protein
VNRPFNSTQRSASPAFRLIGGPRDLARVASWVVGDDDAMPSTLDLISWIAIGYGVLVAVLAAYSAMRWRARPPWLSSMAWMLELLHVVRAVAGVGAVLGGSTPASTVTFVGYLLTSVAVIPVALRAVEDDESVWAVWVIAIAAVTVSVVGWRLMVTQ